MGRKLKALALAGALAIGPKVAQAETLFQRLYNGLFSNQAKQAVLAERSDFRHDGRVYLYSSADADTIERLVLNHRGFNLHATEGDKSDLCHEVRGCPEPDGNYLEIDVRTERVLGVLTRKGLRVTRTKDFSRRNKLDDLMQRYGGQWTIDRSYAKVGLHFKEIDAREFKGYYVILGANGVTKPSFKCPCTAFFLTRKDAEAYIPLLEREDKDYARRGLPTFGPFNILELK